MSAREELTPGQRALLTDQLGDAKPATSGLLMSFGQSIRDRRDHEHPTWEDLFCHNLSSWMGERAAPVLRRLLDAETEIDRLRDELADRLHPYTYTDAHNHRLTLDTVLDGLLRPYVWVEAENLAAGGAVATVWLTPGQAADLDQALRDRRTAAFTDHTGDKLTVTPEDGYTTFEVTNVAEDEGETPVVVRVVTLASRVRELRNTFAALAERAQQRAADAETTRDADAPCPHDAACGSDHDLDEADMFGWFRLTVGGLDDGPRWYCSPGCVNAAMQRAGQDLALADQAAAVDPGQQTPDRWPPNGGHDPLCSYAGGIGPDCTCGPDTTAHATVSPTPHPDATAYDTSHATSPEGTRQ
ncbi:hypothetical protein [Streptomyces antibioticus]|uniref:hypothetical protein n=1 Tax=Streptomyces antibioticus TaxID=1890 RepID=UPI0036B889BC